MATNPWWSWLKGRSKSWWAGVVVTFVLMVVIQIVIQDRYNMQFTFYGAGLLFLGGAVGDWIGSRVHSFRWEARVTTQLARWMFGYRDDLVLAARWWHRLAKVLLFFGIPTCWLWALGSTGAPSDATVVTGLAAILALNLYNRAVLYVVFGSRDL